MNRVISFFEKQQGLSNDLTYDFALPRLCVAKEDSWRGITPSIFGTDYNPEPPIFSAKFANCENYHHILALANEDGKIALQNTNIKNDEMEERALEGVQCHYNAVFDLEWAPGQMKFVSASGDHTARLWEITESNINLVRIFNGHTRSVKSAAFRKNDSAVFATGGRDGAILIWDTRASLNVDLTPRADNCIYSGHVGGPGTPVSQRKRSRTPKINSSATSSSITGLVFQDDMTLVSCGAGDGIIKVWDVRRNYSCFKKEPFPKFSLPYAGSSTFKGFTNLLIDKAGVKLFANCMDNTIYCYNLSSYSTKPIQQYTGLRNSTFYIKSCLSPDENYLISGSSDEKAYIWNLKCPEPLVSLVGHTVEVTCVAWSASNDMPIVTCSDDARHKIWKIGPEKIPNDEQINYQGHAEYCPQYHNNLSTNNLRNRLKALEHTPKTLRRIVEENEKTPSTIEKSSSKRKFSEMFQLELPAEEQDQSGSEQKRPHLETRGRRLFSPSTSMFNFLGTIDGVEKNQSTCKSLQPIEEENEKMMSSSITLLNHLEDSNQENKSITPVPSTSGATPVNKGSISPLTEKTDFNCNSSNTTNSSLPSISSMTWQGHLRNSPSTSSSNVIFSPTSNLPNYILDGDAPHLHLMSPKRKMKEKVDWLTKIRKQKLMSIRTSLTDKITSSEKVEEDDNPHRREEEESCPSLPKLQSLKATEISNSNMKKPRRRTSHSELGLTAESPKNPSTAQSSTVRRNSETSILRFFSIATSNNPNSSSSQPRSPLIQSTQNNGNHLAVNTVTCSK